jgi:hypothetical protein
MVTDFCLQRSGLWNLRLGRPEPITRSELNDKITEIEVPKNVRFGCLQTFRMEGLIMCIKDHKEIPFSTKESDYEQFIITPTGSNQPNYKCS